MILDVNTNNADKVLMPTIQMIQVTDSVMQLYKYGSVWFVLESLPCEYIESQLLEKHVRFFVFRELSSALLFSFPKTI